MRHDPELWRMMGRVNASGHMRPEHQQEIASYIGCRVQDLPLQWRGGLLHTMFGEREEAGNE